MSLPKPLPDADADADHTLADEREYEELTLDSQLNLQCSPFPSPKIRGRYQQDQSRRSNTLTFPKLESDGSLSDLRDTSPPTTPHLTSTTTLTSLEDRGSMAGHADMEGSISSLESEYEFIDTASTASLSSTNDGDETPEDDTSDEFSHFNSESARDLAGTLQVQNVEADAYKDTEEEDEKTNRVMDSYMSEDLETPRQSTLRTMPSISLRVFLYSASDDASSQLAPKMGARIATCIADGHEFSCQTFKLPAAPNNSQGSVLCRSGNTDVIIEELAKTDVFTPDSIIPKMIVVRLPANSSNNALTAVTTIRAQTPKSIPLVIIAESNKTMAYLKDKCDYDMFTTEDEFFHGDEEIMGADLRLLVAGSKCTGARQTTSALLKKGESKKSALLAWMNRSSNLTRMAFGALILALLIPSLLAPYITYSTSNAMSIQEKRDLLLTSFQAWGDQAPKYDNLDEVIATLLPDREPSAKLEAASLLVQPNKMVVSVHGSNIVNLEAMGVIRKPDEMIEFNTTKLLDHVYTITIPLSEAQGLVEYNMVVQQPSNISFKIEHDFGRRVWQRSTYQKAGTDLAKAINKDVAVARTAAKTFTDRIGLEFSAGAAASQNITMQLAIRMAQEVQVFTKAVHDLIGDMASTYPAGAEHASQGVAIGSRELIKCLDDVKKSLATTALSVKDLIVPTKETFMNPIAHARNRALGFKDVVATGNGDASTEAQGKEKQKSGLSSYFSNTFDRGLTQQDGVGGKKDEKKECKDCR